MASSTPHKHGGPTVLCVIDFSGSSESTIRSAIEEAVKKKTGITILHPYRLTQAAKKEDLVKLKRDIDEEATRNFKKLSHLLENTDIPYDFRSEVGFLIDRVQEHIRMDNVKMLVIDKSLVAAGGEGLYELIDQLEIPLMIIPQETAVKI